MLTMLRKVCCRDLSRSSIVRMVPEKTPWRMPSRVPGNVPIGLLILAFLLPKGALRLALLVLQGFGLFIGDEALHGTLSSKIELPQLVRRGIMGD